MLTLMAKINKCVNVREQCLTIMSLERDPQVSTAVQRVANKIETVPHYAL